MSRVKGAALRPVEGRFWENVERQPDGCWLWQGDKSGGYGRFFVNYRKLMAHRWAYEYFVGPVPDGLQLDHLCRVRHCVNPSHLEPVTAQVNTLRGEGFAASNSRKTHCPKGHELAGANLRVNSNGARICVACTSERTRVWMRSRRYGWRDDALNMPPQKPYGAKAFKVTASSAD